MAKHERSAGVLIYHQPHPAERTYLLLNYGKHWDYPKGHVESGESDTQAALRELQEETGITSVKLVPHFAKQIAYFFRHSEKGLIRKEVIFYLGQVDATTIKLSHEHVAHAFLRFEEAIKRVTYPTAKQILKEAEAYLNDPTPKASVNS